LKKKQNGNKTTKKNTKKHKQTHQARIKKSRGMIGGDVWKTRGNELNRELAKFSRSEFAEEEKELAKEKKRAEEEEELAKEKKRAEEEEALADDERARDLRAQNNAHDFHKRPPKFFLNIAVAALTLSFGGYALFGIDRN